MVFPLSIKNMLSWILNSFVIVIEMYLKSISGGTNKVSVLEFILIPFQFYQHDFLLSKNALFRTAL